MPGVNARLSLELCPSGTTRVHAEGTPLSVVFPHGCRALLPPGQGWQGKGAQEHKAGEAGEGTALLRNAMSSRLGKKRGREELMEHQLAPACILSGEAISQSEP